MTRPVPGPETLAQLVCGVTQTMFGERFALGAPERVAPWAQQPPWCAVLLPIPGERAVQVAIAADRVAGMTLGGWVFGCPTSSVDDSIVLDSLRELANIVAGQVKLAMDLDQALGLPRVVESADWQQLERHPWRAATLDGQQGRCRVWVAVCEAAT
jgi:hypothetical protein